MEEDGVLSPPPDITDSVFRPLQEPWTRIDHLINGEQQAVEWSEEEVQIKQEDGDDPKAGQDTPEEGEQWEPITWPVRPMTCASPPLSFATVQWDMPGPAAEVSSLMTDSSLANELDSEGVTASLLQSEDVNEEIFDQQVREEDDQFDLLLLSSNPERTGSDAEPCDAADVQQAPAQEKEDSAHELSGSRDETPPRTDSDEEEGHSDASDPVDAADLPSNLHETEASGDEADSFVDLRLEEEREEPGVVLTGQGESEEEQTSTSGGETEEVDEEQSVTDESSEEDSEEAKAVNSLSDVEVPAELLQTDDAGSTLNTEEITEPRQSQPLEERQHSSSEEDVQVLEQFHEDPAGQTQEPEMCNDVGQNVEPDQTEAAHDNQEALTQVADDAGNSEEIQELSGKVEETSCSQHQEPLLLVPLGDSESEQREVTEEEQRTEDQLAPPQHQEPSLQPGDAESEDREVTEEEEETSPSQQTVHMEAEDIGVEEKQEREETEQNEPTTLSEKLVQPEKMEEFEIMGTPQTAEAGQTETPHGEDGLVQTLLANGEQPKAPETAMNGGEVDREAARRLAERLYKLDGFQRVDVVKHLDKDNDFSRAVGEEYLKFFDFAGQTLDHALRSFLKVVVLIGETQERERVLQHFACRFQQCNPDSFSSSGAALALTCALMLLNTDLHGQNVGKSMSSSKFVSNLDGMNDGGNFNKDLLKSLYNSIKNEALQWAVDEEELKNSVLVDEDAADDAPLRSKANPFQDVPHDKQASVVKEGFLQRKLHADIDGKRTPWGKRGWKTFYGVLKGMVLYLQKDDYRRDQPINEEVVSVHHSLAEQASEYTKRPYVFRLQTADWRVFLFQASSKVEMNSWLSRINLVSALHSSPPFPAAVGSQRRFFRPILPASQSAQTLERQLQSHSGMLESFKADLSYLQQNPPEGKRAKARELEEHRVRAEYLQHEMCRYEIYIQVLEAWKSAKKTGDGRLSVADLNVFDKALSADSAVREEDEEDGLKRSHSSPSLELEPPAPIVIKVRRNISERRTYRRTIIPRWNKEA